MRTFWITDSRSTTLDGEGARKLGGRWNLPGHSVVYASETFSGALLEVLVHTSLEPLPQPHSVIEIEVPSGLNVETLAAADLPGWDATDPHRCRTFGNAWLVRGQSAVLFVPSVVTGGRERNVLFNPQHPDFLRLVILPPAPVRWDPRLFQRGRPV